MNFYDRWLEMGAVSEQEKASSRRVIHFDELEWVETSQDSRAALLISPETGFRTWGSTTMRAEIPPGWHTGKHKHGEEVIYILSGEGFSVIDGRRYDWHRGSTIAIPFGGTHQHFNTGNLRVEYFSAVSVHLEHFVGLHRTVQYEVAGPTKKTPPIERVADGLDVEGNRVALDFEDAPSNEIANHLAYRKFMSIKSPVNDFQVREQEISGILTDAPHEHGGKHAHMEAHIHILEGEGYSIVDDERIPWRPGSSIHIVGPQTVHQHFNESDVPSSMLRIAPGIRYFFEAIASREHPYLRLETRDGQEGSASPSGSGRTRTVGPASP
jgi:quercetin dioxygenase-like cupin family protein